MQLSRWYAICLASSVVAITLCIALVSICSDALINTSEKLAKDVQEVEELAAKFHERASKLKRGKRQVRPITFECNCIASIFGVCPAGQPGPAGGPGLDGVPGAPGQPGANGLPGSYTPVPQTDVCRICPEGERGGPGYMGPPGPKGVEGIPGSRGRDGDPGAPGDQGAEGAPGEAGPPGKMGKKGRPGQPAIVPEVDPNVRVYIAGTPGSRGQAGLPGLIGEVGLPGPQGPPGPPGPPGYPGRRGPPGRKGNDAHYCSCPPRTQGARVPAISSYNSNWLRFQA